jgi:NADPH-dependent 2,4-dienoyl-CoA reductase/sulfur reductase-like enzyme
LIAEPQWVEKLARGEPPRRCLACNTCVDDMRGGAGIGCVVNGAAGRELLFKDAKPPQDERIAVIGAGPAGLTYASLVADRNSVTVFEKMRQAGGSFRLAGKAPLFQGVEADEISLAQYVDSLVAACLHKGVNIKYSTDVAASPQLLAPFDRIVIATGSRYRLGLGPIVRGALSWGIGRWPGLGAFLMRASIRDWLYYRARRPTAERFRALARPGQHVVVIGDAARPGKSKPAIASAFEAALLQPCGPDA